MAIQSSITNVEHDRLIAEILQRAALVVEENWIVSPEDGSESFPVGVPELSEALDALPLAERIRYGL